MSRKFWAAIIGSGTWILVELAHVTKHHITWSSDTTAGLLTSYTLGAVGFSFLIYYLFFMEERSLTIQTRGVLQDASIRFAVFIFGLILLALAAHILYLTGR